MNDFENEMEDKYDQWMTMIGIGEKEFYKAAFDLYNERELVLKKQGTSPFFSYCTFIEV